MANRKQRAQIAADTVAILERGADASEDQTVSIAAALERMRSNTRRYRPDEIAAAGEALTAPPQVESVIRVSNRTTFAAARALIAEGFADPLRLNFASAMNPGGGFLSGGQAQEEALARASGLSAALRTQMGYYEANRAQRSALYADHLIYAPRVSVFRSDTDVLAAPPFETSIVTAPAVNARRLRDQEPEAVDRIARVMTRRIAHALTVARRHRRAALVLGAWGCGVFGNDPAEVARWFRAALTEDPRFAGAFARVEFAVLDVADGTPTFAAFERLLSG